jgi:hypothetical protein
LQLSKEVQRQRDYEGALLKAYQQHLKALLSAADAASKGGGGTSQLQSGRAAVRCMGLLLTSLPHFNYGADLLQVRGGHQGALHCCSWQPTEAGSGRAVTTARASPARAGAAGGGAR